MLIDVKSACLRLTQGRHLRLRAAFDTRLSCTGGTAWITIEGGAGDVILSPGEAFVVLRGAAVLVGPLHGAVTLDLQPADRVTGVARGVWRKMTPVRT